MLKCEMRHRGLGLRLLFCYVYVYVYACDPIRPRKCGTDPNCTTFVNVVHVHVRLGKTSSSVQQSFRDYA